MPEPPQVNPLTRYLFENPWPLAVALLAIAGFLIWTGAREGLLTRLKSGGALAVLAIAAVLIGHFVVTPGERAKAVTRAMVDAAVAGDVVAAMSLFSPKAAFAVGSPRNPGFDIDFIENQLIRLTDRYTIQSNAITMLKGYSENAETGIVHMACFTTVGGFTNMSQWVVRVQPQEQGEWKIAHLTVVTINNNTPPIERMW